ncbi:MAG: adenylate/guanylate cyclase domain-containing protein, partial [Pseudomonadota bacterium]
AMSAISCARSMMESIDEWNRERETAGLTAIRASFGLHYGPVVLGDIGVQRMEFAAIGNTVNVASRLEAMTRRLDAVLIASDAFVDHARQQASNNIELLKELTRLPEQEIEGLSEPLPLWMIARDGRTEVPQDAKPN